MDAYRRGVRLGVAGLCVVLIPTLTGCGNRLSHADIVSAGTSTAPLGVSAPAAAGEVPVTGAAALDPLDAHTGAVAAELAPGSSPDQAGAVSGVASGAGKTTPSSVKKSGTAGGATGATGTPLTVGNIGTYSGVVGGFISGIPKALQVWALSINARGGLNGHPVRIVSGDDGGDPARDISLAKQMIEQDKIIAFMNSYVVFGNATETIEKLAAAAHVPIVAPDVVNATHYTSTNTFPVATYYANGVSALIPELAKGGADKLGLLYCIEAVKLCGGIAETIKAQKQPVGFVYEAAVSITAPSYTSQCLGMKNAGANGAILLIDGASDARALRDCQLVGVPLKKVQVGGFVVSAADMKNSSLQGAVAATPTVPGDLVKIPAVAEYQAAMKKYAPGLPLDPNTVQVWAAGALLETASKKFGTQFRWQDLYAGLYTVKNSTLGGLTVPLTFHEGKPPEVAKCAFYQVIDGGQLTSPLGDKQFCV